MQEFDNKTYDFNEDVMFLEFNGLGKAADVILEAINGITRCASSNDSQLYTIQMTMIGFGMGVLALACLILVPFIYSIQKSQNRLWNQIKNISRDQTSNYKKLCTDRLKDFHSICGLSNNLTKLKKPFTLNFLYSLRYLKRISLFILLGTSYYIITYFAYFTEFDKILVQRPDLLGKIVISKTEVTRLMFWSRNAGSTSHSISTYSPQFYPMDTDYMSVLASTASGLQSIMKSLVNSDYSSVIDQNTHSSLFEFISGELPILNYGVHSASANIAFEANYLAVSKLHDSLQLQRYYDGIMEIGNQLENIFYDVIQYSHRNTQSVLTSYIVFCCMFSVAFILLYFLGFYFFMKDEEKKNRELMNLAKIMIASYELKESLKEERKD